ncbi:hypothetical protein DICA3_A08680 [Diutina catenulata]
MEAYENRLQKEIDRVSQFLLTTDKAIEALNVDEGKYSVNARERALAATVDALPYINAKEDVIGVATAHTRVSELWATRESQLRQLDELELAQSHFTPEEADVDQFLRIYRAIVATLDAGETTKINDVRSSPSTPAQTKEACIASVDRLEQECKSIGTITEAGLVKVVTRCLMQYQNPPLRKEDIREANETVSSFIKKLIAEESVTLSSTGRMKKWVDMVIRDLIINEIVSVSPQGTYRLLVR